MPAAGLRTQPGAGRRQPPVHRGAREGEGARPGRSPARPPSLVAADTAYSSKGNRAYLRRRGIKAVVPEKSDQAGNREKRGRAGGRPVTCDTDLYKDRNTVERCINRIKAWRGLATRYDKIPESLPGGA